jgi:catechol 2,3-dioxygenase-like lactoylglutathione lyase family enzyme
MAAGIIGVDHPVIAVRDMDESHRTYQRLGFTIPPRGSHLEWGTGNWCIMFADDYLELRGIADASRYTHNLDKFLAERGEGLMGVAFATRSGEDSYREAQTSGLKPTAFKQLTRRFHLPEGDAFPKFAIVYLSETDAPGLLTSVICGHLTPDIIRRPEWLRHPNGVTGVISMTAVVADPQGLKPAYDRLFGATAVSACDGAVEARFDRGAVLRVVSPDGAKRANIAMNGASLPYLPAMTLRSSDLRATQDVLRANGVPFAQPAANAIRVEPAHTCGVVITFTTAADA